MTKKAYVVQFRDYDHNFIDQIYGIAETEEEARIISKGLEGMEDVAEAGYEEIPYITVKNEIGEVI